MEKDDKHLSSLGEWLQSVVKSSKFYSNFA